MTDAATGDSSGRGDSAAPADSGVRRDSGAAMDSSTSPDAAPDTGTFADTGDPGLDAARSDGTVADASAGDAQTSDSSVDDGSPPDAVVPGRCINDEECPEGLHCYLALSMCMNCAFNSDCEMDQRCVEGECVDVVECVNTLDCPTGQICDRNNSSCEHCIANADCDDGQRCQNRQCANECDSDLDCMAAGKLCNGAVCVQCVADADCDAAYFCGDDFLCTRDVCQRGESRCANERTLVSCAANGSALDAQTFCDLVQTCTEIDGISRCWDPICAIQETRCNTDGLLETCSDNRLSFGTPTECVNGSCVGDRCVDFCADGMRTGSETDIDCGGGTCSPCQPGQVCVNDGDCARTACGNDGRCEALQGLYVETFDDDGGWTAGGTNSSWEFAVPAGQRIDGAPTGIAIWITNASGDYNSGELSWVQSPVLDFSDQPVDPLIDFLINHETEPCCDEAWFEVSTDGGGTWTRLGNEAALGNWYNDERDSEWSGASQPQWTHMQARLTATAGSSQVRFRFIFSSDVSVQREGIAFDDVRVVADSCNNGLLDDGEAAIDCGGGCACSNGEPCVTDDDCESDRCDSDNTCGSCTDGQQNGDETHTDCGGSCALCPAGTPCTNGDECLSGECESMACTMPTRVTVYASDFDSSNGGWTVGGTRPSWEWGQPDGAQIQAPDGDLAWVTNLTGPYADSELSWIESPALDLTSASWDARVDFEMNFQTEMCCDEVYLELSRDNGATWERVVASGTPTNWYNDTTNQWWDGTSDGWISASTTLPATAGTTVRLRFVLSSDGSVSREGVAIDDLVVSWGPPS